MKALIVNPSSMNHARQGVVNIGLTLKRYIVQFGCIFRFSDIVKSSVSFWPKIAKKRFSVISMGFTFTERM